jgi:hypothetical protein
MLLTLDGLIESTTDENAFSIRSDFLPTQMSSDRSTKSGTEVLGHQVV